MTWYSPWIYHVATFESLQHFSFSPSFFSSHFLLSLSLSLSHLSILLPPLYFNSLFFLSCPSLCLLSFLFYLSSPFFTFVSYLPHFSYSFLPLFALSSLSCVSLLSICCDSGGGSDNGHGLENGFSRAVIGPFCLNFFKKN